MKSVWASKRCLKQPPSERTEYWSGWWTSEWVSALVCARSAGQCPCMHIFISTLPFWVHGGGCLFMYIHTYVRMRTHACTHTCTRAYTRTHARTHTCTHACTHMHTHMHTRTHAHTHTLQSGLTGLVTGFFGQGKKKSSDVTTKVVKLDIKEPPTAKRAASLINQALEDYKTTQQLDTQWSPLEYNITAVVNTYFCTFSYNPSTQ